MPKTVVTPATSTATINAAMGKANGNGNGNGTMPNLPDFLQRRGQSAPVAPKAPAKAPAAPKVAAKAPAKTAPAMMPPADEVTQIIEAAREELNGLKNQLVQAEAAQLRANGILASKVAANKVSELRAAVSKAEADLRSMEEEAAGATFEEAAPETEEEAEEAAEAPEADEVETLKAQLKAAEARKLEAQRAEAARNNEAKVATRGVAKVTANPVVQPPRLTSSQGESLAEVARNATANGQPINKVSRGKVRATTIDPNAIGAALVAAMGPALAEALQAAFEAGFAAASGAATADATPAPAAPVAPKGPKVAPKTANVTSTKAAPTPRAPKLTPEQYAELTAYVPRMPEGATPVKNESHVPEGISNVQAIGALLASEEGTTRAEILWLTGWPAVSVPQQAKATGLPLYKAQDETGLSWYRAYAWEEGQEPIA